MHIAALSPKDAAQIANQWPTDGEMLKLASDDIVVEHLGEMGSFVYSAKCRTVGGVFPIAFSKTWV